MKTKKYQHLSESEFARIKSLWACGLHPSLVKKATGRSSLTLRMISRASTLEEYRKSMQRLNKMPETIGKKRMDSRTVLVRLKASINQMSTLVKAMTQSV